MEYAAEVIRGAVPALEECGVVLAVEPLGPEEGDFLRTADEGVELIRMVDAPQCRLHLDVKAMSTEAKPIPEVIRSHAAWLEHVHANDPNRRGPGMGEVDFVPILKALQDIDYQGWVSVEVFDYTPGPEALARESIENLNRCLGG
jgi:sugar phosphate isomerase/epimerase